MVEGKMSSLTLYRGENNYGCVVFFETLVIKDNSRVISYYQDNSQAQLVFTCTIRVEYLFVCRL